MPNGVTWLTALVDTALALFATNRCVCKMKLSGRAVLVLPSAMIECRLAVELDAHKPRRHRHLRSDRRHGFPGFSRVH